MSSAAVSGQSSVTWQGPPVNPPGTPNAFPDATNPITLSGQIDSTTGNISGGSLSLPVIPITGDGEQTYFAFTEVHPGTATGNFNPSTGAVTLNDSLTLTFTVPAIPITCVSTPINVAFSGTWDSTTQDVTLAASGFTIPDFPSNSGTNCGDASPSLNASPGGTAGAVGNAMSLALNGQFAPGLPTTTTLTTSVPSPELSGTSVTLTGTVVDPSAQGTPTGTVNFEANGASVGTGTLTPSGTTGTATATLTTTTLPQAANQLTAVYGGDTTYAGSTSNTVPYTIQALPSISSTFPSQFTAGASSFPTPTPFTVTISNPAGGATYDNNLFLSSAIYSFNGKPNAANIQLSYEDSAGNWCPMTSAGAKNGPSGSPLADNYGPTYYFSGFGTPPCGFTSAFSLNPGSSLTLNMEIAFESGTANLAGDISLATALQTGSCSSATSCTAAAPLSGATAVTSQAQSTIIPQTGPGSVSTTIKDTGWPGTGTMRSGYAMNLAASVQDTGNTNAGAPTGTVQFFVDGTLAGTTALSSATSGTANAPLTVYDPGPLLPGTHTEVINYSGNLVFAPNTLTETFTVVAGPPTGTPYTCSMFGTIGTGPYTYGAYVTVSGTGVPTAAPSGTSVTASDVSVTLDLDGAANTEGKSSWNPQASPTISFSPGDTTIDPGTTTFTETSPATDVIGTWSGLSVTAEVTGSPGDAVPIGVDAISFDYGLGGSVDCTPVSQAATIGTVSIIGASLAASPTGSAPAGAPVTLTATVAPLPPVANSATKQAVAPGQVDFYDGSTYLGTAAVAASGAAAGTASFTTNALSVGDHQLTAIWSGYSGVPSNTSNTVDYTVGTATTTALVSSANPANAANPVTFTATVSPPPGASTMPTGDVSFTSDGNPIASCQNVGLSMTSPPTATCTTSFAAGTTHSIVATYSGDGTYIGSVSDTLTQTMLPGTNTTILSTKDPSPPGNVTFWSGVSPSSGTGATPTGTVAFTIDGATYKPCNAQPLGPGGGASCTVSFKAGTTHKVFATYSGSASYSGSKSSTITQTVTGAKSSTTPKDTGGSATLASGKSLTAGQSIATGRYKLVMQTDGNLVEYQGSKALWASGTAGHPGTGVVMQKDGNLVEYQSGKAIWASNTSGHSGAHLILQGSDGNVVIYGPGGQAVWNTGT